MEHLTVLRDAARRVHAGVVEILALASLYGVYELVRGIGSVDFASASEHAQQIVRLERSVGVFSERAVQQFCEGIPPLAHTLAILYPALTSRAQSEPSSGSTAHTGAPSRSSARRWS